MTPVSSLITDSPFDLSQPPGSGGTIHVTDSYTVAADQTLDISGSPGVKLEVGHNTVSLDIAGTVTLGKDHAKLIGVATSQSVSGHASVQIDATGSLSVSTDASGGTAVGIDILSTDSSAANARLVHVSAVSAGGAAGMTADAQNVALTNSGSIEVEAATEGFGMYGGLSDTGSLTNSGTITVTAASAIGMAGAADSPVPLDNSGVIHVTSNSVVESIAIGMAAEGGTACSNEGDVMVSGEGETFGVELLGMASFTNTGRIIAEGAAGFSAGVMFSSSLDGAVYTNDGLIRSTVAVASADALQPALGEAESLINNGKVVGAIEVGAGGDVVTNAGRIVGDVAMGDGADLFDGSHGRMEGLVTGGLGADTLIGSGGGDVLYGDEQDNGLGGGDDVIRGMKGADSLIGGAGNDILTGGADADTLTGGDGNDVFKFTKVADSTGAASDLITDLTNSDTIQLSAIDADTATGGGQAFHLVGSFTGAAGQLTVNYNAGTNLTTIAGDTNGDGTADLVITASGDHHDFTNFVL